MLTRKNKSSKQYVEREFVPNQHFLVSSFAKEKVKSSKANNAKCFYDKTLRSQKPDFKVPYLRNETSICNEQFSKRKSKMTQLRNGISIKSLIIFVAARRDCDARGALIVR